jgi:hypothetical protein
VVADSAVNGGRVVATFQTSDELYDVLGTFLSELTLEPELRPKFVNANTSMLVTYTDPEACILIDCRCDPPLVVPRPPKTTEADISLTMSADDGHRFWLGKYNVALGLAKRQVKVSGSMGTMMKLLPAMQPAFSRYEAFLKTSGRDELL